MKINYGAGYTKSGKWHTHLLIRFDQKKAINDPSWFDLSDLDGQKIQGHYETCLNEELVLLYLKRHEKHNVVLEEIGTVADINDAKKSKKSIMISDVYQYSKNFEDLNEAVRLQKSMNYFWEKNPERLNHYIWVERTLLKAFKGEKNPDPFHVDRQVKIIKSYPESSSKEIWEKELEAWMGRQINLCFTDAKNKGLITWLVKALINTGTDPEKIGLIPSINFFFKNVPFLANKERIIVEVRIMKDISAKELNTFQKMFSDMTQINKERFLESGKKSVVLEKGQPLVIFVLNGELEELFKFIPRKYFDNLDGKMGAVDLKEEPFDLMKELELNQTNITIIKEVKVDVNLNFNLKEKELEK